MCDRKTVILALFASKLPQTQMEWAQLLEAQQRYHDAELQKWREIIKSSVVLLDQVKLTICLLEYNCTTKLTTFDQSLFSVSFTNQSGPSCVNH